MPHTRVMQGLSLYLVSFNVKIMFPRLSISLMKISAGLSDVKLCGKIRCVLHLVDVIPMVGSVEIMFLHSPEVMVSFDLVFNVDPFKFKTSVLYSFLINVD